MVNIEIKEPGRIRYQQTTWQGTAIINGIETEYRYSEDDNGAELYILTEQGWEVSNFEATEHQALWTSIMLYGDPSGFTAGETFEVTDEEIEDNL